jgi:hypothetical protein
MILLVLMIRRKRLNSLLLSFSGKKKGGEKPTYKVRKKSACTKKNNRLSAVIFLSVSYHIHSGI